MIPERSAGAFPNASRRRIAWIGLGCALMISGCGTETRVTNDPSPDHPSTPGITERSDRGKRLPPPDAAEIKYDSDTQTLKLYDLPPTARWMVQVVRAGEHSVARDSEMSVAPSKAQVHDRAAMPVVREFKLPEGVDAEKTLIYIAEPGGKQSKAVSLAQVQQANESFTSRVP